MLISTISIFHFRYKYIGYAFASSNKLLKLKLKYIMGMILPMLLVNILILAFPDDIGRAGFAGPCHAGYAIHAGEGRLRRQLVHAG